jgi:hypothetical protein
MAIRFIIWLMLASQAAYAADKTINALTETNSVSSSDFLPVWANGATFKASRGNVFTGAGAILNTNGSTTDGWIFVAQGTSGLNAVPTNHIPSVLVDHLTITNTAFANTVPVWDNSSPPEMVPSRTGTNQLDNIRGLYSPVETELTNKVAKAGDTMTGTLAVPAITVGDTIFTNSPITLLTTSWTASSEGSNYVANLVIPSKLFNMTTNLNLIHTTNGTANFTANLSYSSSIKVINNSGTNFPVTWPATWHSLGYVTNAFTLTNGDYCNIALEFAGPSTDQTNNWIGVAYKSY